MAGLGVLARESGYEVSGSDAAVYPPMSTQLEAAGMTVLEGYEPSHLDPTLGEVVVGNVMRRGMPIVESMLDRGLRYTSGPEWLGQHVLQDRWVVAVAGTHGKTTTSAMLAWILEHAGLKPGFLIGGMPRNFDRSARLGTGRFFVVEADEYDTAFFDKRSKFVHYRPRTLVLNNLEFDHADIFPDIAAIQTQFHHLVRTVPGSGLIVSNGQDKHLDSVLAMGCWTPVEQFVAGGWYATDVSADGGRFRVGFGQEAIGEVNWCQRGIHNVHNALAAVAAARHVGVPPGESLQALNRFAGVKRRLELRGEVDGIRVYDDFAHHPTAIATALSAIRASAGDGKVLAVLEPRSNTMRLGVHGGALTDSLLGADRVYVFCPQDLAWDLEALLRPLGPVATVFDSTAAIVDRVVNDASAGDCVLVMSNGGFENIHQRLLVALQEASCA